MPKREIDAFIEEKSRWIEQKQQQVKAASEIYSTVRIEAGGTLPYLGKSYTVTRGDVPAIEILGSHLYLPRSATETKVIAWMKAEARGLITRRVEYFSSLMGVRCAAIKLSGARGRWGSCSAQDNLNFSWRLIMCPPEVIDYVVVHELSHVTHKHHGADFWKQVSSVIPHYKNHRAWLKANRGILDLF